MFVSFLQRFGFLAPSAAVEPIRSFAGRDARPIGQDNQAEKKANKRQDGRITLAPVFKKTEGHPQASAQRRQDVNAPAKKSKSVVKVAAKVAAQVTVKPALKTAVKATVSAKKVDGEASGQTSFENATLLCCQSGTFQCGQGSVHPYPVSAGSITCRALRSKDHDHASTSSQARTPQFRPHRSAVATARTDGADARA
jgi:hypothetical protein